MFGVAVVVSPVARQVSPAGYFGTEVTRMIFRAELQRGARSYSEAPERASTADQHLPVAQGTNFTRKVLEAFLETTGQKCCCIDQEGTSPETLNLPKKEGFLLEFAYFIFRYPRDHTKRLAGACKTAAYAKQTVSAIRAWHERGCGRQNSSTGSSFKPNGRTKVHTRTMQREGPPPQSIRPSLPQPQQRTLRTGLDLVENLEDIVDWAVTTCCWHGILWGGTY